MPPIATMIGPLSIVVLSIPLIAGWVKRNYFYGFRTPRTLASDAVWYPANRVAGVLLCCAGTVWLAAGLVPGLIGLGVAIVGSVIYLSRLPTTDEH